MTTKDWFEEIGFYDETSTDRVRIAIYGDTKVGKTTLGGSFPKPFFIDTDRGGRTLKKLHIPHISIPPYDRTFDLINDILIKLGQKEAPFDKLEIDTVVFDSVTALADFLIYDLLLHPLGVQVGGRSQRDMKRSPSKFKPERDDYGVLRIRLNQIFTMAKDLPVNVVAICGEKMEQGKPDDAFLGKPAIVGSYRDMIGYAFDEYYHMATEGAGEKTKYVIHLRPHILKGIHYMAGSRDGMPAKIENPSYQKLFEALKESEK